MQMRTKTVIFEGQGGISGGQKQRIVIEHRLSTIKSADRIIMLKGGQIIEDGDYQTLIDKNGKFAELVNRQRLDN